MIKQGFSQKFINLRWVFILVLAGLLHQSCLPVKKETVSGGEFVFDLDLIDPTSRLVYNWQDRMNPDSLIPYFTHSSPKKRFIAVMAFGSNPDSTYIPNIAGMLEDTDLNVRIAAAYALGQCGNISAEKHLLSAWIDNDQTLGFAALNSMILESVGKCGSLATLKHMAEMDKLVATDTLMLLGQSRGILRFLLRGIHHSSSTKRMMELLEEKSIPLEVKRVAAVYFSRLPKKEADPYLEKLTRIYRESDDLPLQNSLITAISLCTGSQASAFLLQIANNNKLEASLIISALKGLYNHPGDEVEQVMDQMLFSNSYHYQEIAGAYFISHGAEARAMYYFNRAKSLAEDDFAAKYQLISAALKHMPLYYRAQRDSIHEYLHSEFKKAKTTTSAVAIVRAMGYDFNSLVPLKSMLYSDQSIPVRSAAAEALGNLAANPQFDAFFKSYAPESRAFIVKYLSLIATDYTQTALAPATQALIDAGTASRVYLSDTIDWVSLTSNLVLPRQNEDYDLIAKLYHLIYPDSVQLPSRKTVFNNPVDWDAYNNLTAQPKAVIATNKGMIEIALFKNYAPATVVQFVKLSKNGYYKEKTFHRVVPNFVIQGGCNRGDGYGSLDASIRTETPPLYFDTPGLIGMASAGRHTESQQFFITQLPAMHLDGKYTIFGKVVKGMEVVNKIKPGDWIESVVIL
jgi:cyclophilin family peptidyl-prolyl cis-trans isomerase